MLKVTEEPVTTGQTGNREASFWVELQLENQASFHQHSGPKQLWQLVRSHHRAGQARNKKLSCTADRILVQIMSIVCGYIPTKRK